MFTLVVVMSLKLNVMHTMAHGKRWMCLRAQNEDTRRFTFIIHLHKVSIFRWLGCWCGLALVSENNIPFDNGFSTTFSSPSFPFLSPSRPNLILFFNKNYKTSVAISMRLFRLANSHFISFTLEFNAGMHVAHTHT